MHYKHDSDCCTFLGSWRCDWELGGYGTRDFDLYWCDNTILARYGNDGPDYTSGYAFAKVHPALAEAYRRAKESGLQVRHESEIPARESFRDWRLAWPQASET